MTLLPLHLRVFRAAAVAVFAPGCHAALHAIGSIEDVVPGTHGTPKVPQLISIVITEQVVII